MQFSTDKQLKLQVATAVLSLFLKGGSVMCVLPPLRGPHYSGQIGQEIINSLMI